MMLHQDNPKQYANQVNQFKLTGGQRDEDQEESGCSVLHHARSDNVQFFSSFFI